MDYTKASEFILNKVKTDLPECLKYHSYHHIMDVLDAAITLAEQEGLSEYETLLLKTAVLYHDSGFTRQSNEHEKIGCDIAKETLPNFGYSEKEIEQICGMIMATKIPQTPTNLLEQIICDADLDYLGRDDFWQIGNNLYDELVIYSVLNNEKDELLKILQDLKARDLFPIYALIDLMEFFSRGKINDSALKFCLFALNLLNLENQSEERFFISFINSHFLLLM
ncbi:MAG: HD domain-containing protein, partial [Bacteroidetes bacterium]|nr:HD domain-containing protein [Bacteroidota bacterium]